MKLKNLLVCSLVLALLVSVSGCLFSPDDGDPIVNPDKELPFPKDPDTLMANFKTIYSDMMLDEFKDMLHTEYRTILLQATMDEWAGGDDPLTESYFTRDDEIRIHTNIFSGNSGVTPLGNPVPPVSSIDVDYLQKDGTWESIEASDPDFAGHGGYWATFNVLLYFNNPDNHRFEINQVVEFYVAPIDEGGREKWLLLGQRGQDN